MDDLKKCIELCWQARAACQKAFFSHCLEMGGDHVAPDHVKLMIDCMQICQTAADFMTRNSDWHESVCGACAAVCEACAESCRSIGDGEMKKCADICQDCAESCREMSAITMASNVHTLEQRI